jgi:hypothetical protein
MKNYQGVTFHRLAHVMLNDFTGELLSLAENNELIKTLEISSSADERGFTSCATEKIRPLKTKSIFSWRLKTCRGKMA